MTGRIWFLAVVAALAFAPVSVSDAHAQQRVFLRQQQLANCVNEGATVSPQVSIQGCTAVIRTQGTPDRVRAQAFTYRGQRYLELGDSDRALADFSTAIRTSPTLTMAVANRAELYMRRREFSRAVVDYSDYIRFAPVDSFGYNGRCWARAIWNASLELARADCNQALSISPADARIFDSRGMVGLRQERWQDAWSDYDAAVHAENHPHYLYGRGIAAIRLGRVAEGQADLAAATALDASIAETYAGYGVTP